MGRRLRALIVVMVGALGLGTACTLLVSTSSLSGEAAPSDGGSEAPSLDSASEGAAPDVVEAGPSNNCPGVHGGPMVRVGFDGGPSFCIDATEVTNGDYAAFLASSPTTAGLPAACSSKTSFLPTNAWPPGAANAKRPVVWVDWCDAYAFCAWAGKRLCGRIGGGSADPAKHDDPTENQSYFACSGGGAHAYPYGDAYDKDACNGTGHGVGGTVDVGSMAKCEGGFPGVFDLVGNVCEWQDSCNGTSESSACLDGPGSFVYPPNADPTGTNCHFNDMTARNNHVNNIGIRCCGP
jgi:formylglycine-generating enzyme required for sulfatase activity